MIKYANDAAIVDLDESGLETAEKLVVTGLVVAVAGAVLVYIGNKVTSGASTVGGDITDSVTNNTITDPVDGP